MAVHVPVVESRAGGVLVARYDWPHLLLPEMQGELVACALEASARDPVGIVFVLSSRICEVSPVVRTFWRKTLSAPALRISAMTIVTGSWAVEVEAMGFGVAIERLATPVRVAVFRDERRGIIWATQALRTVQQTTLGTRT